MSVGKFEARAACNAEPVLYVMPVNVGINVIAGVVVGFATLPERPFALATETLVTVPEPPPPHELLLIQVPSEELKMRHWPFAGFVI